MERFILYSPNGKHGVNTLNCKARYDEQGTPIYPEGWQFLTEEQVNGLNNKTLAWENGKLIPYAETAAEITTRQKEIEREEAIKEIAELQTWFNDIYDQQIKQAERCKRLGTEYDNKYGTVAELDNLAEEKAARIKELRVLMGS